MRRFEKINTLTERTLPTILAIVIPELKLYFEFGLKSSFKFALQFGVADNHTEELHLKFCQKVILSVVILNETL